MIAAEQHDPSPDSGVYHATGPRVLRMDDRGKRIAARHLKNPPPYDEIMVETEESYRQWAEFRDIDLEGMRDEE